MESPVVEAISVQTEFADHPEHFRWIGDLNAAWAVARGDLDSSQIKWHAVPVKSKDISHGTFYFKSIQPSPETPSLSNRVFCVGADGKALSNWFGAPVLFSPGAHNLDALVDHELRSVAGEPAKETLILNDVLTHLKFPAYTPVYRCVFFLPIPPQGESYETHFFPMISTVDTFAHTVVVENDLIGAGQISHGGNGRKLMMVGADGEEHYFRATFTPDAASEGRIVIPRYEGRMLILSQPVQVKREMSKAVIGDYDFIDTAFVDATKTSMKMAAVEVDTVSVGRGMRSQSRAGIAQTTNRYDQLPCVFDIRCIGVRRTDAGRYTADRVKELFCAAYGVPTI